MSPYDSNIMDLFYNYYCWLGSHCYCMNALGSKKLYCNCQYLKNDDPLEAVVTYVFTWTKILHCTESAVILWHSLLNTIKTSGVNLGGRWEYIFPVDATNISGFDINVVNTNKICTSAWLSLFEGRKFWYKITTDVDTRLCANSHGNTGKKHAFQPMTEAPLLCMIISRLYIHT